MNINIFIYIPFEWTMDNRKTALRKPHKWWSMGFISYVCFPLWNLVFNIIPNFQIISIDWIWEGCLGYNQGLEIIMSLSFNGLLDDNVPKCILVINIYMNTSHWVWKQYRSHCYSGDPHLHKPFFFLTIKHIFFFVLKNRTNL